MGFRNSRKSSASSSFSSNSSSDPFVQKFIQMTHPIGPREDNFNMDEKTRQQRILAMCRKAREPWRSAKPLHNER